MVDERLTALRERVSASGIEATTFTDASSLLICIDVIVSRKSAHEQRLVLASKLRDEHPEYTRVVAAIAKEEARLRLI